MIKKSVKDNLMKEIEQKLKVDVDWKNNQKSVLTFVWRKYTFLKQYKTTALGTWWQFTIKWGNDELLIRRFHNNVYNDIFNYLIENINLTSSQISSAIDCVDNKKPKEWIVYKNTDWFFIIENWKIHYFDNNGKFQMSRKTV